MNNFICSKNVFHKELFASNLILKAKSLIESSQTTNKTIIGLNIRLFTKDGLLQGEIEYIINKDIAETISFDYVKSRIAMIVPQCNITLSQNYNGAYRIFSPTDTELIELLDSYGQYS